jgi:hypothetical protein
MCIFTVRGCAMSLLSGLFTELEKVPAPRFLVSENVAAMTNSAGPEGALPKKGSGPQSHPQTVARMERVPATHLEQHQQPRTERMPARDGPPLVDGPPLGEDHDQPQQFIQTAITASPEWLAARDAFYHHLMACRSCYAPTGRYCPASAELHQRYDLTPMV